MGQFNFTFNLLNPLAGVILMLSCLSYSPGAQAVLVKSLYSATVPITTRDEPARRVAIDDAFAMVMTKVTGNPDMASSKTVRAQSKKYEEWVRSFKYTDNSATISFDPKAVQEAVKIDKERFWGENRPLTMVWLVVTGGYEVQQLVGDNADAYPIAGFFKDRAQQLALPVQFPELTRIEGSQDLAVEQILTNQFEGFQGVEAFYKADLAVFVVAERNKKGLWESRWTLRTEDDTLSWVRTGKSMEQSISAGIDKLARYLAIRYGIDSDQWDNPKHQKSLELTIHNISTVNSYAAVYRNLQDLGQVRELEVSAIDPDAITFKLRYVGDYKNLVDTINLDPLLRSNQTFDRMASRKTLDYRLYS